jgi:acetylxylan esterase
MKTITSARVLSTTLLAGALALSACVANADDPGADQTDDTAQAATACSAVEIITARASGEAAGEGITGALVTQIINSSHQTVGRASVTYPATLNNYASSSAQGVSALKQQLTTQVQNCPSQKIVLAGYSQGAHVILDVLGGGGGGSLGATTAPIAANIASHVVAVISFGDPRHVTNQAFDLGTSRRNGLFPRTNAQLQALSGFSSKINAYCDTNDEFCDSGVSLNVHLTYLDRYQDAGASFVLGKIGG